MKAILSNRYSALLFVSIVAVVTIFSALVPPMQSPDETAHFARAHMLSRGIFLLNSVDGQSSGGQVDIALSTYMSHFTKLEDEEARLNANELAMAKTIKWSEKSNFATAPGTGYYFPVLYAPYALGLWIGERSKLSVHNSYMLARFVCTLCIAFCIVLSARLFPFNPLLMYLLVLPTSLFQYATLNLDGIVAVLSVLMCSLFARIVIGKEDNQILRIAFFILIAVLASCKLHLFAIYILGLFLCLRFKNKIDILIFLVSLAFVVAWTFYAVFYNVDTRIDLGMSSINIAAYYLSSPLKFLDVLSTTLKYPNMALGYVYYLVSITPLRISTYHLLAVGLIFFGLCSFSWDSLKNNYKVHGILLATSIGSILAIFFLLLVTWTPHPAPIIWGVQGRYFWVPTILLSFALSGSVPWKTGVMRKLIGFVFLIFTLTSLHAEVTALLSRYYLAS